MGEKEAYTDKRKEERLPEEAGNGALGLGAEGRWG